jgi:hypothetical protein
MPCLFSMNNTYAITQFAGWALRQCVLSDDFGGTISLCWMNYISICGTIRAGDKGPNMHRHEFSDLWVHDDHELAAVLESPITGRETLHQWPLSSVDRVATADGRTWIYKTQYGPTIEAEFYAQAKSDLLVPARIVRQDGGHVMMLFEFVDAPLIEDLKLSEDEILRIGREVVAQVDQIEGDLPHWLDISSKMQWRFLVARTCDTLQALVENGKFTLFDTQHVNHLREVGLADDVCAVVSSGAVYVHGDLTGDNLFVLPDGGYRLVDWSRPILGPAGLDLATLLESMGIDPLRYVDKAIIVVMLMLRIHWLAQCAVKWIPGGGGTYDQQIADWLRQLPEPQG